MIYKHINHFLLGKLRHEKAMSLYWLHLICTAPPHIKPDFVTNENLITFLNSCYRVSLLLLIWDLCLEIDQSVKMLFDIWQKLRNTLNLNKVGITKLWDRRWSEPRGWWLVSALYWASLTLGHTHTMPGTELVKTILFHYFLKYFTGNRYPWGLILIF